MKTLSVFIVSTVLAGAPALGAESLSERLSRQLGTLALDVNWMRSHPIEPDLFAAVEGEAPPDERSSLSVQLHPLDPRIQGLRERIRGRAARAGDRLGIWQVVSVAEAAGGCHELALSNPPESERREIRQTWCFGAGRAAVMSESGPRRLSEPTRRRVLEILRAGVGAR